MNARMHSSFNRLVKIFVFYATLVLLISGTALLGYSVYSFNDRLTALEYNTDELMMHLNLLDARFSHAMQND